MLEHTYTENFFSVELTFELSLTWLLSHLGSNVCKTQDQSHSDATPLYYRYIYLHMAGHGEKFRGEKSSIYKQVIYYFPSRRKIKYLIVFSPNFFFLKWFLKFLTKISVKKNY